MIDALYRHRLSSANIVLSLVIRHSEIIEYDRYLEGGFRSISICEEEYTCKIGRIFQV